jgi:hypothetical protein
MPPKSSQKKPVKKGGMLMDDVNKLVVPFGLLLAERGLSNMMKQEKKQPKAKVPKKKKTSGGSLGTKNLSSEFKKLSSEIETFLSQY